ncbi:unnamed protein product [Closterium sp. NIES-54]
MECGCHIMPCHPTPPSTPTGRQPPSSGLPCTPLTTAVIIPVNSEDDFARRLQYPSTITVVLELQNHILLSAPLLFNASFACTVLRSAARPARGFQLTLMRTDAPLLWIAGASNVLVLRVSFFQPYAIDTAACQGIPYMGTDVICPAIHIYQAANVQVARGTVYGRIDVYWSVAVRVDGMKVTGLGDFKRGQGLIRVAFCGHGPTMQRSQVVISNNEVFGACRAVGGGLVHAGLLGGDWCVCGQGPTMQRSGVVISNNEVFGAGRGCWGGGLVREGRGSSAWPCAAGAHPRGRGGLVRAGAAGGEGWCRQGLIRVALCGRGALYARC